MPETQSDKILHIPITKLYIKFTIFTAGLKN